MTPEDMKAFDTWWDRFYAEHCETPTSSEVWTAALAHRDSQLGEAGWQPIETAPMDGTEVLLFAVRDMGLCYWRDDETMTDWTWGMGMRFINPTHWMLLPKPPHNTKGE